MATKKEYPRYELDEHIDNRLAKMFTLALADGLIAVEEMEEIVEDLSRSTSVNVTLDARTMTTRCLTYLAQGDIDREDLYDLTFEEDGEEETTDA